MFTDLQLVDSLIDHARVGLPYEALRNLVVERMAPFLTDGVNEKALPCPYCGCNKIVVGHKTMVTVAAWCSRCGARTQPVPYPLEKEAGSNIGEVQESLFAEALRLWNMRA